MKSDLRSSLRVFALTSAVLCVAGYSNDLKCQAIKPALTGERIADIPVVVVKGNMAVEEKKISFAGSEFSAIYNMGSVREPETDLKMRIDKASSYIYNLKEEQSYVLMNENLVFQCSFRK